MRLVVIMDKLRCAYEKSLYFEIFSGSSSSISFSQLMNTTLQRLASDIWYFDNKIQSYHQSNPTIFETYSERSKSIVYSFFTFICQTTKQYMLQNIQNYCLFSFLTNLSESQINKKKSKKTEEDRNQIFEARSKDSQLLSQIST